MKKTILLLAFAAALFSFAACEADSGPTMNEDYAGTWYNSINEDTYTKLELTDTTFLQERYESGTLSNAYEGKVTKKSSSEIELAIVRRYIDGTWYSGTDLIESIIMDSATDDGYNNIEDYIAHLIEENEGYTEAYIYSYYAELLIAGMEYYLIDGDLNLGGEFYTSIKPD